MYERGDSVEVNHPAGGWLPGRIERFSLSGADVVLTDGERVLNVPSSHLRPAEIAVAEPREIAVRVAMMPTERVHDVTLEDLGTLRCEWPSCGRVRVAGPTEPVRHVRVTHGGDTDPWTLRVTRDDWTIADDLARVAFCPDHSGIPHPWLAEERG